MRRLESLKNISESYRCVRAELCGGLEECAALRSADDVFVFLAEWRGIEHTRSMLEKFSTLSGNIEFSPAIERIRALRLVASSPSYSVSVSFVGKRNYSAPEVKEFIQRGISAPLGAYSADDRSAELNIRIFIEGDRALVGLRVTQSPLHDRSYKKSQIPGSLKPSVAAALVEMSGARLGSKIVDPCCGAGTILIEAACIGYRALGGDINSEAVSAARENAADTEGVQIEKWDARAIPLADRCADHVISNLPWGLQVTPGADLASDYGGICSEIERIVNPAGTIVLLTTHADLVRFERFRLIEKSEISLFGQRPLILKYAAQLD